MLLSFLSFCQKFSPGVGEIGTTAISKDSAIFLEWASEIKVIRGPMDISNTGIGVATFGSENDGLGFPDGKVISLGDGGEAVVQFKAPISDGIGPDFAVFENSFNNTFLELAFVEVSSDGKRFVRFPAVSLSQDTLQFGNDAVMNPSNLNNLAGKYKAMYGTPFDLDEIKDSNGIDIESITHVKLIDVVGSIDKLYGTKDNYHQLINDPFPTPFPSSGFDLEAIGVIHSNALGLIEQEMSVNLIPNPSPGIFYIQTNGESSVEVSSIQGEKVLKQYFIDYLKIDLTSFPKGMYIVNINGIGRKVVVE